MHNINQINLTTTRQIKGIGRITKAAVAVALVGGPEPAPAATTYIELLPPPSSNYLLLLTPLMTTPTLAQITRHPVDRRPSRGAEGRKRKPTCWLPVPSSWHPLWLRARYN